MKEIFKNDFIIYISNQDIGVVINSGNNTNRYNTSNVMMSHTSMLFDIFSIDIPVMLCAAYKQTPIGGVISPNDSVITVKITKNTGSIPTALTVGIKIGTRMKIAAVASINIPTMIKKTNSIERIIRGLSLIFPMSDATLVGSPSYVNTQLAAVAVTATNKIVPVIFAVLKNTLGNCL